MAETMAVAAPETAPAEHVDVLIVGAGISGVGGAYHLQEQCPGRSFLVLEAQDGFGGTWRTHRYPGIRSDSDLYPFGYPFKPWVGAPIATAEEIRKYMGEVIEENGLGRFIRYGHRIRSARWDSATNRWTIECARRRQHRPLHREFPLDVPGYYRHEEGYTPNGRAWRASVAASFIRRPGRRTRLRWPPRGGDRVRCDRRDHRAGDGG